MHGPTHEPEAADPDAPRRARIGLALFAVYLVLYGGFVLVNAFAPRQMERDLGGGVNLAVGWGVGLIAAALALALAYAWLCRTPPAAAPEEAGR